MKNKSFQTDTLSWKQYYVAPTSQLIIKLKKITFKADIIV